MTGLPPPPALKAAIAVALPLLTAGGLADFLGGTLATLALAIGCIAAVPTAISATSTPLVLATAVASTGSAALGTLIESLAGVAVGVVLLSLAQAPMNTRLVGSATLLPVLFVMPTYPNLAASTGLWAGAVAGGFVLVVVLARILRLRRPAVTVTQRSAALHAVATALAALLALLLAHRWELPHGYWLVLTTVVVLRPFPPERPRAARDRIAGTVAGLAAAVLIVFVLPSALVLALALGGLLLAIAWALAADERRQTAWSAIALVLLGSAGLPGPGVALALERLVVTVTGVAIAVAAAIGLAMLERGAVTPPEPPRSPEPPESAAGC